MLQPFAAAQAAVSRLDEWWRRSPWRNPWMQRVLFHQACASQRMEGDLVHIEDLVLLDGNAFSGAPSMALSGALEVLRIWRAAEAGEAGKVLRAVRPGFAGAAPLPESGRPRTWALRREQRTSGDVAQHRSGKPEAAAIGCGRGDAVGRMAGAAAGVAVELARDVARGADAEIPRADAEPAASPRYRVRRLQVPSAAGAGPAARIAGFSAWAEAAAEEGQKKFDSLVLAETLLRGSLRGRRSELAHAATGGFASGAALCFGRPCIEGSGHLAAGRTCC